MIYLMSALLSAEFWIGLVVGIFVLDRAQFLKFVKFLWNHTLGLIPGLPKF